MKWLETGQGRSFVDDHHQDQVETDLVEPDAISTLQTAKARTEEYIQPLTSRG